MGPLPEQRVVYQALADLDAQQVHGRLRREQPCLVSVPSRPLLGLGSAGCCQPWSALGCTEQPCSSGPAGHCWVGNCWLTCQGRISEGGHALQTDHALLHALYMPVMAADSLPIRRFAGHQAANEAAIFSIRPGQMTAMLLVLLPETAAARAVARKRKLGPPPGCGLIASCPPFAAGPITRGLCARCCALGGLGVFLGLVLLRLVLL